MPRVLVVPSMPTVVGVQSVPEVSTVRSRFRVPGIGDLDAFAM
jgi:hypothetical protein